MTKLESQLWKSNCPGPTCPHGHSYCREGEGKNYPSLSFSLLLELLAELPIGRAQPKGKEAPKKLSTGINFLEYKAGQKRVKSGGSRDQTKIISSQGEIM